MYEVKAICDGTVLKNDSKRIILVGLPDQSFVDGFKAALELQYSHVKVIIESIASEEMQCPH